jgi:hypothetical protein
MPNVIRQIKHTFAGAPSPLSEVARYVYTGWDGGAFRFVEASGPEAARQLLRHLTNLPTAAHCLSTEQFVMGYVLAANTAGQSDETNALDAWNGLLADAFSLAQVDDIQNLQDGAREFQRRVILIIERGSAIASPRLTAWGILPEES